MDRNRPPKKPIPEDFGMTHSEYVEARARLKHASCVQDPFSLWWIAALAIMGVTILLKWPPGVFLFMACGGIARVMDYIGRKTAEKKAVMAQAAIVQEIRPYEQAVSAYQRELIRWNCAHERYWKSLRGSELERQLAAVYRRLEYTVTTTKATGDQGIDLLLRRDGLTIIVQCKGHGKPIGIAAARDLYGTLIHHGADRAILVCPAGFTQGVVEFVRNKEMHLVSAADLVAMAEKGEVEEAGGRSTHVAART